MLLNDVINLLMAIPPMLAGQWAAWFFFGLILSIWSRHEKVRLVMHGHSSRHDSGVRPLSGVRAPVRHSHTPSAPLSAGDAFSDLEALLAQQPGTHRPGDLDEPSHAPALAAPQSLP